MILGALHRWSWQALKSAPWQVLWQTVWAFLLTVAFSVFGAVSLWVLSSYWPQLFLGRLALLPAYAVGLWFFGHGFFLSLQAALLSRVFLTTLEAPASGAVKRPFWHALAGLHLPRPLGLSLLASLLAASLTLAGFQLQHLEQNLLLLLLLVGVLLPALSFYLQADAIAQQSTEPRPILRRLLWQKSSWGLYALYLVLTLSLYSSCLWAETRQTGLSLGVEVVFMLGLWPWMAGLLLARVQTGDPSGGSLQMVLIPENGSRWVNLALPGLALLAAGVHFGQVAQQNQLRLAKLAEQTQTEIEQVAQRRWQRPVLGSKPALPGDGASAYLQIWKPDSGATWGALKDSLGADLKAAGVSEKGGQIKLETELRQKYQPLLLALHRAAQHQSFRYPFDAALRAPLPSFVWARQLLQLRLVAAETHFARQEVTAGFASELEALRWAQDLGAYPLLVAHMQADALLREGASHLQQHLQPKSMARTDGPHLLAEFRKLLLSPLELKPALWGEKLVQSQLLLQSGQSPWALIYQPYLLYTLQLHEAYWDELLWQVDTGMPQQALTPGLEQRLQDNVFTAIALPNDQQQLAQAPRPNALLRGLYLQVALAAFDQQKGHYPTYLSELVPGIIPALPLDPYSGRYFRYRAFYDTVAQQSDYRLYSVGADRQDQGGKGPLFSEDPKASDFRLH